MNIEKTFGEQNFQTECIHLSRELCTENKLPLGFNAALKGLMGEKSAVNLFFAKALIKSMARIPLVLIMMRKPYLPPKEAIVDYRHIKPGEIYTLAFINPVSLSEGVFLESSNRAKATVKGIQTRMTQGTGYGMYSENFFQNAMAFSGSDQTGELIVYYIFKPPYQQAPPNWEKAQQFIAQFEKTYRL